MSIKIGFEPIIDDQSSILILGTLPGDESIIKGEYYANNSNKFWEIISHIHGEQINLDYESRVEFLHRHGIALWDVIKKAKRIGSKDKNICKSSIIFNDLEGLIKMYPSIRKIGFNGRTAEKNFIRRFKGNPVFSSIQLKYLMSSSSAYARKLEVKVEDWQKLFVAKT